MKLIGGWELLLITEPKLLVEFWRDAATCREFFAQSNLGVYL